MDYPIYSPVESRDGTLTRGGFMKNSFVEQKGQQAFDCFRRPGLLQYSTNTGTPQTGRGMAAFKDFSGNEKLYAVQGASLYADGALRTVSGEWTASSGVSARIVSGLGNIMQWPTIVTFKGFIWAIGSGSSTGTVAYGSATRFMVAYSGDLGRSWNVIVDVASAAAGFPTANRAFHACVHLSEIYIVGHSGSAGSTNREIWKTSDGAIWTQTSANHGIATDISRILSHSDGNIYFFFMQTLNPIYNTPDGVTLTLVAASAGYNTSGARIFFGVSSFANNMYVLGGFQGTNSRKVYRSTNNGVSWAELGTDVLSFLSTASTNSCQSFFDGPVCYLHVNITGGVSDNDLYSSTNFTTWTAVKLTTPPPGGSTGNGPAHDQAGLIEGTFIAALENLGGSADASLFYLDSDSSSSTPISLGAIIGQFFDFAQNYARDQLILKSEGAMYVLNTQFGFFTQVTDTDYPTLTVRGLVYLDGVFYVMDPDGNIFNSADEDATSWDATDFVAAQFEPDGGVCLIKYGLYIVAFGEYSTEFFYNAGNATGSPLGPVQNGVVTVGCSDGDTVNTIDGQVIFVAQSKTQGQGVAYGRYIAQLEGTGVKKLSTPDIDRILEGDDFEDVEATTFKVAGHAYYHLRLGSSNMSMVYDLSAQQWYVWTTRRSSFTATVSGVVTTSGTATATVTSSFADGDVMIVSAFTGTHTALNGTYNVGVAGNVLTWNVGTGYSGTSTGTGTMTGRSEDDFPVVCAATYQGKQLLQDKDNGAIYELDLGTYRDNGVYMDWLVQLTKLRVTDNQKKFAAWADFVSDRGSANVLMRFSDDDCQSFTKYRSRSMSGQRTRWHRLGSYRERVYDVRVTDNVPVRARHLALMEK